MVRSFNGIREYCLSLVAFLGHSIGRGGGGGGGGEVDIPIFTDEKALPHLPPPFEL
jgi:hypothetical protein